jgi:hypothetical protein
MVSRFALEEGEPVNETAPRKNGWRRLAIAVVAISGVFSALLTYLVFAMPSADPVDAHPTLFRLVAAWLLFTFLLSLVFAAGIWRMTAGNDGAGSEISPMKALIALAATLGLCGFSVVAVAMFRFIDARITLFAVLAIALVVGLLIVRQFKAGRTPPPGGAASA